MVIKPFVQRNCRSMRYYQYAYMDHESHVADSLFIQRKIEVTFLKDYVKPGEHYHIVVAKIKKSDRDGFIEVMNNLRNAMFIHGITDYDEAFQRIWVPMSESIS